MHDGRVKPRMIRALVIGVALLAAAHAGTAQAPDSALVDAPAASPVGEPAAGTTPLPTQTGSGRPPRRPPPRTLQAFWPVFAAFTLAWLGLVGYMLTFNGRLKRVAEGLDQVEGSVRKEGGA